MGAVVPRRRRRKVSAALAGAALIVLGVVVWSVLGVASQPEPAADSTSPSPSVPVLARPAVTYATASAVPVLVYHEMNNGCSPTAPVCKAGDPETVSTAQFTQRDGIPGQEGLPLCHAGPVHRLAG